MGEVRAGRLDRRAYESGGDGHHDEPAVANDSLEEEWSRLVSEML